MQRDLSIDILRFIALSGIILVHINPSLFWCQLRSFDVPLMVLLSGVSYSMSSGKDLRYDSYCWKRFKRLVLPVWFFLLVYFFAYSIYAQHLPPLHQVVSYYTLMTGWYVWIIRVFFIVALFAPIIYKFLNKVSLDHLLFGSALLLLLFECFMNTSFSEFKGSVYLLMNIPYLLVFAIGCRLQDISNKKIVLIAACCLFTYLLYVCFYYWIDGEYILTQAKKYPPQLYYTSYALACCFLLWLFRFKITNILPTRVREFCVYIGSHTMWIYLWHIPFVPVVEEFDNAFIRYVVIYILSIGIVFIQCWIVDKMLPNFQSSNLKMFIKTVFVG